MSDEPRPETGGQEGDAWTRQPATNNSLCEVCCSICCCWLRRLCSACVQERQTEQGRNELRMRQKDKSLVPVVCPCKQLLLDIVKLRLNLIWLFRFSKFMPAYESTLLMMNQPVKAKLNSHIDVETILKTSLWSSVSLSTAYPIYWHRFLTVSNHLSCTHTIWTADKRLTGQRPHTPYDKQKMMGHTHKQTSRNRNHFNVILSRLKWWELDPR